MPEISSLTRAKPVETVLDFGDGDTVRMTFDAHRVTPAWVAQTQDRVDQADSLSLPKALAEVILDWDVTDDGAPYPPSAENLAGFPFPAMAVFFERIMEASVPGVAEGNASSPSANVPQSATSEPTSPISPNGSDTSTSPTPSVAAPLT